MRIPVKHAQKIISYCDQKNNFMKKYQVVPYVANITIKQTSQAVAQSVEDIINDFSRQGWTFETIERIETKVSDPGCFGVGAKASLTFLQLIIFSREN